ncbi:clasp N terminal-domain-containing protein [Mycena belliarum]|uniref:Clasp N terminal-domain-containing protein n=1 Tax=Mycena belliarum TaxID=1033014 RepID=A0AAD6U1Z1_9AGAR|nr:clasp N terminal-domain-containing protein [Mycena belliae]
MNLPTSPLQQLFDVVRPRIFLPESEETWDTIARSLTILSTACNDVDSYVSADLVAGMRSISRPLISAMNSERGRLSGVAIDLVAVAASSLGVAFDALLAHFFPVLLVLSSRTSKVTVARARTCITTIIEATQIPAVLTYLMQSVADKSVSLRLTIVDSTLVCMNCFNPPDLEKDSRAKEIEAIIRTTARDANADVRKVSKKVFEAYKLLLPSRLDSFTTPLTPTTRKYLDIPSKAEKIKLLQSHAAAPPRPAQKAAQLSSSTSAVRASSSRRPQTHARSASSPAVAPDIVSPVATEEQPFRNQKKGDMGPPKLPNAVQTSRQADTTRSTGVDRKRVVSMFAAVRPAVSNTKLDVPERERPVPISNHPLRRPQPVEEPRQPVQTTSVVARRVPISEVQLKADEKPVRARPRLDHSASTPAIRHTIPDLAGASKSAAPRKDGTIGGKVLPKPKGNDVRSRMIDSSTSTPAIRPTPIALAESSKPPAPRVTTKPTVIGTRAIVKPKGGELNKQRSLTQPTLSQISRAKAVERRVPVPTVSKFLRSKTVPHKAPTASKKIEKELVPTLVVTPAANEQSAVETSALSTTSESDDSKPCEAEVEQESEEERSEEAPVMMTKPQPSPGPKTPPKARKAEPAVDKTPISELLLSIEQGFIFTPSAPLSPPQSYLPLASANLPIPFPLNITMSHSEQQAEEEGDIANKAGIRHLELRRALGDVALNK